MPKSSAEQQAADCYIMCQKQCNTTGRRLLYNVLKGSAVQQAADFFKMCQKAVQYNRPLTAL
jgi:hypothetical protein